MDDKITSEPVAPEWAQAGFDEAARLARLLMAEHVTAEKEWWIGRTHFRLRVEQEWVQITGSGAMLPGYASAELIADQHGETWEFQYSPAMLTGWQWKRTEHVHG